MSEIENREAWIIHFLRCAHQVDSTFKRGNPKMKYVPIQTSNGRRNPVSLWQEPKAVKISFTIDRDFDFEARLISLGLPCSYKEHVKHLETTVTLSPSDREAILLEEIAKAAFLRALPTQTTSRRKAKDRLRHSSAVETAH